MGAGDTDSFSEQLNALLVDTFWSILKVEEKTLKASGRKDLSISEMHLIEAADKSSGRGKTISNIADDMGITLPSVTVAINKLVKKGYVEKIRAEEDGRVVFVVLTELGRKMDAVHRYFHHNMVRSVGKELTEEEKALTLKAIGKLNAFFERQLAV